MEFVITLCRIEIKSGNYYPRNDGQKAGVCEIEKSLRHYIASLFQINQTVTEGALGFTKILEGLNLGLVGAEI